MITTKQGQTMIKGSGMEICADLTIIMKTLINGGNEDIVSLAYKRAYQTEEEFLEELKSKLNSIEALMTIINMSEEEREELKKKLEER